MILIGLTGGIGMGKSTVAEYLSGSGEKLIDTDRLARELVERGMPALEQIRAVFGEGVFTAGELDRRALGVIVFRDAGARKKLEAILHPAIRSGWRSQVAEWRNAGQQRAVVVIPLLYETGAEAELEKVFCVGCSEGVQRQRLKDRGWTIDEIAQRNAAQWPIEKKMDRADGVIWNEHTRELCEEQCARLFAAREQSASSSV